MEEIESEFLQHEPCPACGSKDNLARYDDGHAYCFGCEYYEHGDESTKPRRDMLQGTAQPIASRKLSKKTCQKFGYIIAEKGGESVQVAQYFDERQNLIAQKTKDKNKNYSWSPTGMPDVGLYGQWLWRDGGKQITITEGEVDCLSVSQAQDNKWPVVSLSNGIASSVRQIKKNLEWLDKFERVNLCFDMDEPGRKYVEKVANLFAPGKARIVNLPLKDASDMLVAGRDKELIDCLWGAKPYNPDGIVAYDDMLEYLQRPKQKDSKPYPFEGLNEKTHGIRRGELVTVVAGTGVGKSQLCRQIAYSLLKTGERVGYIALEESVQRTLEGLMALEMKKVLHTDFRDWDTLSETERTEREDALHELRHLYLYDHFGSIDSDNLLSRIRYLTKANDVSWIVLDHLSIMSSAFHEGDERRMIDATMTNLRSLVQETNCGMILVSHLRRPSGDKGYEDGMPVTMNALRGSHSIGQLSDIVISVERNVTGDEQNVSKLVVQKNRTTGLTGPACFVRFDPSTTEMLECMDVEDDF